MFSDLASYYNTLLTIEITLFGIFLASVLIFIQIVYSRFPEIQIKRVWKDIQIILLLFSFLITILLIAMGSVSLSQYHNPLFPFVTDIWYVVICTLLIFLQLVQFIILIFTISKYLSPDKFLLFLGKKIKYKDLQDYLWSKYEFNENEASSLFADIVTGSNMNEKTEINEEETKENLKDKKQSAQYQKTVKEIKAKVTGTQDPFSPLEKVCIKAIQEYDFVLLNRYLVLFNEKIENFLSNTPKIKRTEKDPSAGLKDNAMDYYIIFIKSLISISLKENLDDSIEIVMITIDKFVIFLLKKEYLEEVYTLSETLKRWSDKYFDRSTIPFRITMQIYKQIIDDNINKNDSPNTKNTRNEIVNSIIENIRFLGEKYLEDIIPKQNILINENKVEDENTDYGVFFEAFMAVEPNIHQRKKFSFPDQYYFAIKTIWEKAIEIYNKFPDLEEIWNFLTHILIQYHSMGIQAVRTGDTYALSRTFKDMTELQNSLPDALKSNAKSDPKNMHEPLLESLYEDIIEIAYNAYGNQKNMKNNNDINIQKILEDMVNFIAKNVEEELVRNALGNMRLRERYDYDLANQFMKDLALKM